MQLPQDLRMAEENNVVAKAPVPSRPLAQSLKSPSQPGISILLSQPYPSSLFQPKGESGYADLEPEAEGD